jgi:hypothetical protein
MQIQMKAMLRMDMAAPIVGAVVAITGDMASLARKRDAKPTGICFVRNGHRQTAKKLYRKAEQRYRTRTGIVVKGDSLSYATPTSFGEAKSAEKQARSFGEAKSAEKQARSFGEAKSAEKQARSFGEAKNSLYGHQSPYAPSELRRT